MKEPDRMFQNQLNLKDSVVEMQQWQKEAAEATVSVWPL